MVHILFCEMWVQLCFVHRGAGRDMTIEGAQWSQSFQISNQSLVRFSSWNTGSWDDHNWRVRFLTGAQFLYNPGPTHIFPMGDGSYSYCLLLTLVSGLQQRIRFPSLFKFGPLWCVGVPKCESCERGDHADAPWQSSTSQDADNKQWELKLSQTHFEFLLIKSSTRRSYLVKFLC